MQILAFSQREPILRRVVDLCPIVEESARLLRSTLPSRISLDVKCDDGLSPVLVDATQIVQILMNLGTNAAYAMKGKDGLITILLSKVGLDEKSAAAIPPLQVGEYVRLSVIDTGLGMTSEIRERIFEPFFTTKPVGEGTGLGLSVVHGIMHDHQGAILVESELGRGTRFDLYFPISDSLPEWKIVPQAATIMPRGEGQHILYIDDDSALLELMTRLLERQGYDVSAYINACDALDTLRDSPLQFDLLITDFNMPTLSGLDVAREARLLAPALPIVIASGYINDKLRDQAEAIGVQELIFKPNAVIEFANVVHRLINRAAKTMEPDHEHNATKLKVP